MMPITVDSDSELIAGKVILHENVKRPITGVDVIVLKEFETYKHKPDMNSASFECRTPNMP